MTRARQEQISPADTPYYHVISRCVRRAFLCGEDQFSGQSFEHRRQWVLERLSLLDQMFAIDICAYAIMSNHYHLVLYINQAQAQSWSDDEVIKRWQTLFVGPMLIQRYQQGKKQSQAELNKVAEIIAEWRERLMDISWFMRCLNEHIARKANQEDNCKGRFWEGRFKSQALLDEQGLLTCMAYVDLNPVRAVMADSPENSDFTSIQQRIREFAEVHPTKNQDSQCEQAQTPPQESTSELKLPKLKPLSARYDDGDKAIMFDYADYMELVDWAGRCCREDKRGYISGTLPPILSRLGISPGHWLKAMQSEGLSQSRAMGCLDQPKQYAKSVKCAWLQGSRQIGALFHSSGYEV
ncbi:transposase [Oceanospirillum beijerinckii]|uniref:transposase n=1 Tax=Oceanospirillum beijerinckii TaxID=64976 RepID=UPI0004284905|nr:transposase [Oceanospirillum beijerinckii]